MTFYDKESPLTNILEGLGENYTKAYNEGLEAAKLAVMTEFFKLRDSGRQEQFDLADITYPIESLKR